MQKYLIEHEKINAVISMNEDYELTYGHLFTLRLIGFSRLDMSPIRLYGQNMKFNIYVCQQLISIILE